MDKGKNKKSKQSVWHRMGNAIFGKPSGPSKAQGKSKDNRPSIAERINWGGQFPDKKKGK